jgi:uncharacterized protein involved in exopolysaccharide biosynthesis
MAGATFLNPSDPPALTGRTRANSIANASPLTAPELRSAAYPSVTVRDVLNSLYFYRKKVLIAFLVPIAMGLIAALLTRPNYLAQARLLVLYGSEYVFHPGNSNSSNDITLDRNQIMQGEEQILTSTALAMETLKAVGIARVYPGTDVAAPDALAKAAVLFEEDLTVSSIPMANVVELSFRSTDRTVAADALQELIKQYQQRRLEVFDKPVGNRSDAERAQFAERLQRAEAALAQYGAEHGISNLDEQISLLLRQKADNLTEQNQTDQAIRETAARVDSLRKQLASVPQSVQMFSESVRSQQASGLTDSLLKLESTRRDLRSRYQDNFPLVVDVDQQIAAMKAQIAATSARDGATARQGRNTVYDELHSQEITLGSQLQGLQARRAELAVTATGLNKRLDELNNFGRTYRDLKRSRDVLDESYHAIARTSEEAALSSALERAKGANVRVVQPPEVPLTGTSRRKAFFGVGLLLGVLAAAATLAVLNALRQIFITAHDVERALGLPVLAAVPEAVPTATRTVSPEPRAQAARVVRPSNREQPSYSV